MKKILQFISSTTLVLFCWMNASAQLTVTVSKTNATSGCNGTATATATGGSSPYVYSWSTGGNTSFEDSLCVGSHSIIVTDINGLTDTASFTIINDTASLSVSVTKTNATSGCNGSATATANGGSAPYSYSWSNGGNAAHKDSLCAGTYTVTVTDINGLTANTSCTITNDTASLSVSVTKTNATSGCNGSATATANGGSAPYTYLWSNGGNAAHKDSLCAGTYTVTVTDINGLTANTSCTITNDTASLSVSVTKTNATSGCNGSATATANGGSAPYTYLWSNGGNAAHKDSLCAGTYTITVTDINGLIATASCTITNDTASLSVSVTKTNATSGCNGNATATAAGGSAPYSYSWSNGGNAAYKDSLCAGTYTITITDINGLIATASCTITNDTTSPLSVTVTKTNATSGCNGNATATAAGGSAPYSYSWSNGGNASYKDSLCAGTYTITITDINGLIATASCTITNDTTSPLSVTVTKTNATSGCNGNATATAAGGSAPYSYLWSNGGNASYKDSLCAGTYTITITDINGLIATASCTITNDTTSPLSVTVTKTNATSGCNGNATATAAGGSAPYSYLWSNGGNASYKDTLCAGTYTITVTDINGLTATASCSITLDSTALIVSVSKTQTTGGICNGTATASTTGGSAPYVYTWSTGGNGTYKDSLCVGTFSISVTDINGATGSASFTITADTTYNPCNSFTASISATLNQTFPGACNGTATSTVSNGVAPYLFNWGTGLNSTTHQFSGLCAGSFTLTVTDANGCSTTAPGSIGTDSVVGPCNGVVINVALTTTSASAGVCDGAVFSTVAGGTAPYHFIWSNGYHTTNLTNTCPGYYNVQVKDAIGCLGASTVFVQGDTSVPIPLMVSITTSDVDSIGACNGTAHVNAAGGVGPYTIVYSNGFSGGQVNNLCGGYYSVYITDSHGLHDSLSFVIGSPENTYINNNESDPLHDSVIVATLTNDAILSCGIDLTTIDSIAVTNYYLGNNDSIVVIWTLYSTSNGDTLLSQIYGAGQNGVYDVVLSLFCDGRSAAGFAKAYGKILVNDQLAGIKNNTETKTKTVVYPNPFSTTFNINLKEAAKIIVTDITGQTIIMHQANSGTLQIPMSNFAQGIYFVIIENNKGREVTKLIKE